MLKDAVALLAFLKDQEKALLGESIARKGRDKALIAAIEEDGVNWQEQNEIMLGNTRHAIKLIEGTQEAPNGQG